MNKERSIAIAKLAIQQLEDAAESASIDMRICRKVKDEKGYEQAKTRAIDLEQRIKAAEEIVKEYEAVEPKE
jgi:hypothetical protein